MTHDYIWQYIACMRPSRKRRIVYYSATKHHGLDFIILLYITYNQIALVPIIMPILSILMWAEDE